MTKLPIITWFEIPSTNFERAIAFYEAVFKVTLLRENMECMPMAIFPHTEEQSAGAIVHYDGLKPSADGVCIYLYSADFDAAMQRIEANGGKIVMPKTSIDPNGFIALFIDTEGNRVGLHTKP